MGRAEQRHPHSDTTIKLSPVLIISEYCYKILAVESCIPGLFFMIFNTFRGKFVQYFCHHCWLYANRNKKPKLSCISHMIISGLNNNSVVAEVGFSPPRSVNRPFFHLGLLKGR